MRLVSNIIVAQYDCIYFYRAGFFFRLLELLPATFGNKMAKPAAVEAKVFLLTSLFLVNYNSSIQRRLVGA